MSADDDVLERVDGRSGELVLRRRRGQLEVILNGAFLISTENDASSRAMVAAAGPQVAGEALEVLIGASASATRSTRRYPGRAPRA